MGALAAGQVVVLPFPFSDLSQKKLRPALLLATAGPATGSPARSPAIPMRIHTQSR